MLARVLLTAALAAYAIAVGGNGLDRVSGNSPGFERLVPGPFRAQADRSAAAVAISRQQGELALALARDATARDPVDPDSTAELGAAYLLVDNTDSAAEAFRVAARFGWRNLATQLYWFAVALQAQDYPIAVDRADAILRAHPTFAGRDDLLAPLESDPVARRVLADHLAREPRWLESYLDLPDDPATELVARRLAVVREISGSGKALGCKVVPLFVRTLLDQSRRADAESVWNKHCPDRQVSGLIADPGFAMINSDQPFPFSWRTRRSGDVSIHGEEAADGSRQLVMQNTASVARLVLSQPVAVPAGVYRLSAKLESSNPDAAGRLVASFGCEGGLPNPRQPQGVLLDGGQLITVPDCAGQQLGLWLFPSQSEIKMGPIEIEKIG